MAAVSPKEQLGSGVSSHRGAIDVEVGTDVEGKLEENDLEGGAATVEVEEKLEESASPSCHKCGAFVDAPWKKWLLALILGFLLALVIPGRLKFFVVLLVRACSAIARSDSLTHTP
jgi:hypothetical protein